MTKGAALQGFFSRFGLTAYPVTAVPDDCVLPYLVYTPVFGAWESKNIITVDLWFKSESEAVPNAKAQEISDYIELGGVRLPCDGGIIWITRAEPFSTPLVDEDDNTLKRRQLNIYAEFLTAN